MKAITIMQPYAELIASGQKRVENRTWQTHHRGPIAIHAGVSRSMLAGESEGGLTFGAIVAVAELVECLPMIDAIQRRFDTDPLAWVASHEHTHGPVCWVLENVRRLETPIPCCGKQGLWNVPEELLSAIGSQLSARSID